MTIVIAPKAQEDLRLAYAYVYRDNPKAADQLLARITEIIGSLATGLMKGKEVRLDNGRVVQYLADPAVSNLLSHSGTRISGGTCISSSSAANRTVA